jgi:starch synthase
MRVAYLCADPGIPVFGSKGASVHVQEIIRAFRDRGDEVTVYCVRRGDDVPADLADLRVVELRVPSCTPAERESAVAEVAAGLAAAVVAEGCDLVYERYALFSSASARVAAALGVPAVLEVNAPLIEEQRTHRVLVDGDRALAETRAVFRSASVVACVSEPVSRWVRSVEGGARVVVAPNGVNTRRIAPATGDDPGRPFTVGFVGTLKPWHGVHGLLLASAAAAARSVAAGAPPWRLVIAGDGPEAPALRELARRLVAPSLVVEFTGAVSPTSVPAVLAGFDVASAPYPAAADDDQYFSPLKVFEYLAAGLPVVASAVGQLPALLAHGENGLLVRPGDDELLADTLLDLHDRPALRARLGAAARSAAVERHDWRAVLALVLAALPAPPHEGVSS